MPISKITPASRFVLSESEELVTQKKKQKRKQESVIVSDKLRQDMVSSLLEAKAAPELPDLDMIRSKIQNNEYQVDFEKLAESMLELEKLWVG